MKTKTETHTPDANPLPCGPFILTGKIGSCFKEIGKLCPYCRIRDAAPDLLEAAKVISGWIERVSEEVTMGPDDNKALNNLRAAIAKAQEAR